MSVAELLGPQREWENRGWFPPGPQLALCLPGRAALGDLTDAELVEVVAGARRQVSWAQARELSAIAELSRRRTEEEERPEAGFRILSPYESLLEEVSTALTVTGDAAATLVHLADRLATDLPCTREALEAGTIDLPRARIICDAVDDLDADLCEKVEAAVFPHACQQTTGQLRRRVKRIVRRLAPEQVQERTRTAVQDRRLELWQTPTGTAGLALLDINADDAHAIHQKIGAVAHALRKDGDPRTIDQIRADLATELLRGNDLPAATRLLLTQTATAPTDIAPRSAEVVSGVANGVAAEPRSAGAVSGVAMEVARQGAAAVETRAADASVTSVVRASTVVGWDGEQTIAESIAQAIERSLEQTLAHTRFVGQMHKLPERAAEAVQSVHEQFAESRSRWCQATGGHEHTRYRPPAAMRRMIEARHPTCVFPTCNRRSEHCDLDHTIAHGASGATCPCNLAPLCRRHHRTKQTPGWRLFQPWPGVLVWITPSGTWHITLPERQ